MSAFPESTEHFPRLQCGLLRAEIDFERHVVTLYLPAGHCTDMSGAIDYAKELDPQVRRVITMDGPRRRDTEYRQEVDDKWIALDWAALRSEAMMIQGQR